MTFNSKLDGKRKTEGTDFEDKMLTTYYSLSTVFPSYSRTCKYLSHVDKSFFPYLFASPPKKLIDCQTPRLSLEIVSCNFSFFPTTFQQTAVYSICEESEHSFVCLMTQPSRKEIDQTKTLTRFIATAISREILQ